MNYITCKLYTITSIIMYRFYSELFLNLLTIAQCFVQTHKQSILLHETSETQGKVTANTMNTYEVSQCSLTLFLTVRYF